MSEISFAPARYAKGKIAVHCISDGSGLKTRAMALCSAVSSRWSRREKAYIMSPSAAAKVKRAFEAGEDAILGDRNGKLGWVMPSKDLQKALNETKED